MCDIQRLKKALILAPVAVILLASCGEGSVNQVETLDISNSDPVEMCIDSSVTRVQEGDTVEIDCDVRPMKVQVVFTDPSPGTTFAKIKCQCRDESDGMHCPRCTCQGDAISNCDSFAAWCKKQKGAEELGGGGTVSICLRED